MIDNIEHTIEHGKKIDDAAHAAHLLNVEVGELDDSTRKLRCQMWKKKSVWIFAGVAIFLGIVLVTTFVVGVASTGQIHVHRPLGGVEKSAPKTRLSPPPRGSIVPVRPCPRDPPTPTAQNADHSLAHPT
jgi:hypothetical protein